MSFIVSHALKVFVFNSSALRGGFSTLAAVSALLVGVLSFCPLGPAGRVSPHFGEEVRLSPELRGIGGLAALVALACSSSQCGLSNKFVFQLILGGPAMSSHGQCVCVCLVGGTGLFFV